MKRFLLSFCLLILVNSAYGLVFLRNSKDTSRSLKLNIKPMFGERSLLLDESEYVTDHFDTIQVEHFRFYISSVEVIYENGYVFKEKESYHLVDFEKPESTLLNIRRMPQGIIVGIRFNLGVDSLKSTSGAMSGDLDPRYGMYWAWNSGYINAKLEGHCSSCRANLQRYEFHIGGYSGIENALRQVTLPLNKISNSITELVIEADIAYWFKAIELKDNCSIMIPGKKAIKIANNYAKMFRVTTK